MRRLVSIILLFISFGAWSNHQVPGVVVFSHETISVTFDVPTVIFTGEWDFSRLQNKAYYYDSTGSKHFVKPKDALELHFFIGDSDTIRMISIVHKGRATRAFAQIVREGKVNVYSMQVAPNNFNTGSPTFGSSGVQTHGNVSYNGYVLVKRSSSGPDVKAQRLMFRKEMIEFFNDCPEVVKEIEEQELTNTELPIVIDFYYQFCDN